MPRRNPAKHLSVRQESRIRAIRERRRKSFETQKENAWTDLAQKEFSPPEEGRVITHFGFNVEVEDHQNARFRCAIRETAGEEPVCGDQVLWSRVDPGQGVIWSIMARKNVLSRPVPYGGLQTVAANVDQMLITMGADRLNTGLLDRYLVAGEAANINSVIVVNKMDLEEKGQPVLETLKPYQEMGYPMVYLSMRTGQGLDELEAMLKQKVSVFVGQSGVGKSSIIAKWNPDTETSSGPKVGEVHEKSTQGRHTTSVARMYPLPQGGSLIDSPGVREFGLFQISRRSLTEYFRDLKPFAQACHFSDCTHQHEPGCDVKAAVERGDATLKRYESLMRIYHSLPAD